MDQNANSYHSDNTETSNNILTDSCIIDSLKNQFEIIRQIGKGGFGTVVKVKNKTDEKLYAIKLIPVSCKEEEQKLTREVKVLANLNHENIIRYNTSWIVKAGFEQTGYMLNESSSSLKDGFERSIEFDSSSGGIEVGVYSGNETDKSKESLSGSERDFSTKETENDPKILIGTKYESSESSSGVECEPTTEDKQIQILKTDSMTRARTHIESKKTSSGIKSEHIMHTGKSHTEELTNTGLKDPSYVNSCFEENQINVLCIQMEYCEQNLKEFIDKGKHFSDQDEQNRIILEILDGVEYIHKQGVMHRDLKPTNIFLDKFGHVKIGDFGFARHNSGGSCVKSTPDEEENYNSIEELGKLFHRSTSFTQDLGTYFYRSPEIADGSSRYDYRVDLYSLGVIIFELCFKFSTDMERCFVLENLRKRDVLLPKEFYVQSNSVYAMKDIIIGLLQHDPDNRIKICDLRENLLTMENEEVDEIDTELLDCKNDDSASPFHSIGYIRVKGKPKGLCFRTGSKYVLTAYTVIERIKTSKFCSVAFLNRKISRKNQIYFRAEKAIKWASMENNLAIIELNTDNISLPPPIEIDCMEDSKDDTLALIQIIDLNPFSFEIRLLAENELKRMDGNLYYFSSILTQNNMGSPVIRMSDSGTKSVCGMVLANLYEESQKTGTCVIDIKGFYECLSPTIPFALRKEIFGASKFYQCHEHLMIRIENLEKEMKKLRDITDKMIK